MTMEQQVRQAVARGYCHPKNSHKEVDSDLLIAISEEVVKSFSPAAPPVFECPDCGADLAIDKHGPGCPKA